MPAMNSVQGDTNLDQNFQCQSIAWANKVIKPIEKMYTLKNATVYLSMALLLARYRRCPVEDVTEMVDYVFGRPKGEVHQEVGGAVITLASLCGQSKIDMMASGWQQLKIAYPEAEYDEVDTLSDMQSFQNRVYTWLFQTFGVAVSSSAPERSHRFLEESFELVQASGMTKETVKGLVDKVYSDLSSDYFGLDASGLVGQCLIALACFCDESGLDLFENAEIELERIEPSKDKIRAKHKTKPSNLAQQTIQFD